MRICFKLNQDDVVGLLSRAAAQDENLLGCHLRLKDIRWHCMQMIEQFGVESDGWDDEVPDSADMISEWAKDTVNRFNI